MTSFVIVDDRSDDGTYDLLEAADDVAAFAPVAGSTYAEHKRKWRSELLDKFCAGRWAIVPDIDEHMVFAGMEHGGLPKLVDALDADGCEAAQATMIDMYADGTLGDMNYSNGRLTDAFPLFDAPDCYHRLAAPKRFRRKFPTPFFMVVGGMRQRVFEPVAFDRSKWTHRAFLDFAAIENGFVSTAGDRVKAVALRQLVRSTLADRPLFNLTKIPLVKWRRGMTYYNGAHALSGQLALSKRRLALLHFNFAGGMSAIRYKSARGQHAAGSNFYRRIEDGRPETTALLFDRSLHYVQPQSLGSLIS